MKSKLSRIIFWFMLSLSTLFISLLIWFHFFQEQAIFHPTRLDKDFAFSFEHPHEEINIETEDSTLLNTLIFEALNPKGIVIYFHGNTGSLDRWGDKYEPFISENLHFVVYDYRGYGKSTGQITKEEQLLNDAQTVFDEVTDLYPSLPVIIVGYSLGSGPATYVSSSNKVELLILNAPYSSMESVIKDKVPYMPNELIRYKLNSTKWIPKVKCPIWIVHGSKDRVIALYHSEKLASLNKRMSSLMILKDEGHQAFFSNPAYSEELSYRLQDISAINE